MGSPLDYGPVLLRKPFRFHLAVDTLPSGCHLAVGQLRLNFEPYLKRDALNVLGRTVVSRAVYAIKGRQSRINLGICTI